MSDIRCTCAPDEAVGKRQCHARYTETGNSEFLVEAVMFPETDELSYLLSATVMVLFKRRLVDRVLRLWVRIGTRRASSPPRSNRTLNTERRPGKLSRDRRTIAGRVLTFRRYWGKLIICALPQR
jgi:hypothetical protein